MSEPFYSNKHQSVKIDWPDKDDDICITITDSDDYYAYIPFDKLFQWMKLVNKEKNGKIEIES